ncbi:hypothetical protein [Candidatus Korobacter versatilis]|nr:hypothetical protein [Candidatus Koribacter versatilis]
MIRFSGQLKDANRTVGITFTLHKSQQDNASLWTETQNVKLDESGKYSVLLGAMKQLPVEVFTSGEAQWLGIHVEGQAEQRVLLVSVPYALKAAEAETLAGHAAGEFVTTEKLTQTLQQGGVVGSSVARSNSGGAVGNVVTNLATNFTDNTTNQVVLVTQNGSGNGLVATAKTGNALQGTTAGAATYGVLGTNSAASGTAVGVRGSTNSPSGIAVYGTSNAASGTGTGVKGVSASPSGYGVFGQNSSTTGTAVGFRGSSASTDGVAIYGTATSTSGKTKGLIASVASTDGIAALFQNTAASGKLISGQSGPSSTEVFWVDNGGNLSGTSLSATTSGTAIYGSSTGSEAIYGYSTASVGVYAIGSTSGVYSRSTGSGGIGVEGVAGTSTGSNGVIGYGATGVAGFATVDGSVGTYGNAGASAGGRGVWGTGATGVLGSTSVSGGTGLYGDGGSGSGSQGVYGKGATGVNGVSLVTTGVGVHGKGSIGVQGEGDGTGLDIGVDGLSATNGGDGVFAYNGAGGDGIYAGSVTGYAAWLDADVHVNGALSKSSGSFKIDHPLDPANKYLYHSFVESPDMMNIYNGNVTTDSKGMAVVKLPEYFEALNRDFRYQLTVIGQFAQAIVGREIANGEFTIKTDKPNVRVSWQVTGVRQDAWANAHRVPVEQDKPGVERGSYLHPELFGAKQDKSVYAARHPAVVQHQKAVQEKVAAATKEQ